MSEKIPVPEISVVMPVYNGRRHLRQALDGVRGQTLRPRELVVVDDGSSDGSAEVVAEFVEEIDAEFARRGDTPWPVRVVRQDNAGQSAARNRGIRESQGEFVAFLDQDDRWYPEHLVTLAAQATSGIDVGWVYADFDEIDGEGRVVTRNFLRQFGVPNPKPTLASCVVRDLMVLPSASLIRRAALEDLGGFDERLLGYEDDDLFVRVFRAGWRHAFVERSTLSFRIHGVSSSADQRFAESRRRYAEKLAATLPDDTRMRRYYLRDLIAPRFFETCLDDYVRACSERDWKTAAVALDGLNHFARLRPSSLRLRWKMRWVQSPRLFRRLVQLNDALPSALRFVRHPAVTLR